MSLEFKYKSLVESLKLLALPYEDQVASLPDFVVVQDEVMLGFGDAFLLIPEVIENDMLTLDAIAWVIRSYNQMDVAFHNHKEPDDFKNHESWTRVRKFARTALEKMGEEPGRPDLSHVGWVPAG